MLWEPSIVYSMHYNLFLLVTKCLLLTIFKNNINIERRMNIFMQSYRRKHPAFAQWHIGDWQGTWSARLVFSWFDVSSPVKFGNIRFSIKLGWERFRCGQKRAVRTPQHWFTKKLNIPEHLGKVKRMQVDIL